MPAPDPHGIETGSSGPLSLHVYHFLCQNKKHRDARAQRILSKLRWGQWCCPQCGGYVPLYRRADAVYCRESCRKRAAKARRNESAGR